MLKIKEVWWFILVVIEENVFLEIYVILEKEMEILWKFLDENDNVYFYLNFFKEKIVKLNFSMWWLSYVIWRNECIVDLGRGIKVRLLSVRGEDFVNGNELIFDKWIDNIDGVLVWIK